MYKIKIIRVRILSSNQINEILEDLNRISFSKQELDEMLSNIPEVTFTNI